MNYRRKEDHQPILPRSSLYLEAKSGKSSSIGVKSFVKSIVTQAIETFNWKLIGIFFIIWVIIIHYFERIYVINTLNKCQWNKWEFWEKEAVPHRLALVADPQIVDDYSYQGRPRVITNIVKKISDNYVHRNHLFMHQLLDPDTTIFLGDLFDGGREWSDSDWFQEYRRFQKIFPHKVDRRTLQSIPGNHDIGFETINEKVRDRFAAFFGESNDFIELGNHSIIMLDTISLSSNDPKIKADSMEFLSSVGDRINPHYPRILLSHVPLYRFTDVQSCGPMRESKKPFPVQKGKQYQTVIEYEISQTILRTLNPKILFAGDDHDYCEIEQTFEHNGEQKTAKEIAVKSASMTSGIKYPAIQLLSLYNPQPDNINNMESNQSFKTSMCYLPSPYFTLNLYILSYICSLLFLGTYFLYPSALTRYLNMIGKVVKKKTILPQFEDPKWKPQNNSGTLSVNHERSMVGFLTHSIYLSVIICLIFGFYFTHV